MKYQVNYRIKNINIVYSIIFNCKDEDSVKIMFNNWMHDSKKVKIIDIEKI